MTTETPDLISLGKIVKTQGVKGAFRVYPHGGDSENLADLDRVIITAPGGRRLEAGVLECRRKGTLFILSVEGIASIDEAERLVGAEVLAHEEDLAPLPEGEFYWYELVGLAVVDEDGRAVGEIESIMPTGANDVLQIRTGNRELLLPNIPDVVLSIDLDAGQMVVRLLDGMEPE
jgi:16S rRNA processing protein RimM